MKENDNWLEVIENTSQKNFILKKKSKIERGLTCITVLLYIYLGMDIKPILDTSAIY